MGTLTSVGTGRLLDAGRRAAGVLVDNAIAAGGRATWLGASVAVVDGAPVVVERTGDPSLYDGSAGVALAGWWAAGVLDDEDLAAAAVGAARHAVASRDRVPGVGLFDGLAGVGLAALDVGRGAGDGALVRDGTELLRVVAGATPPGPDVVSGGAGVVLALLAAARHTGSPEWLEAAAGHGERLVDAAVQFPWGWGWPVGDGGRPPLCGLAHGAAGVAWALGELGAATGDGRFSAAVEGARRYERSWFAPATNDWPDLRGDETAPRASPPRPALWCHGSVGIGLTRLALYRHDRQPWLAAEAAAALQSSTAHASSALAGTLDAGLTVCHGLGGTVLLLLAAREALGEPEHLQAARWITDRALDRMGDDPSDWPCGVRGGGFSPGLMTGLAGAMYVLLRAADPAGGGVLAEILGGPGPGTAAVDVHGALEDLATPSPATSA